MNALRRCFAVLLLSATLVACRGGGDDRKAPDVPLRPAWEPVALPVPAGAPGRVMLRDVVTCAGRWWAVGAMGTPDGGTRPAAWTSPDARTWTALPLVPKTFYGRQNILSSVACRGGTAAVLGAKIGGAHANPRTSSWSQRPDGALVEVIAGFELFGGPSALDVTRVVGGPKGWMITGNRMAGAAAWVSRDATGFEILEGVPELASDARGQTWGYDVAPTADGWTMVGGIIRADRIDRDPQAWFSVDGRSWQRTEVASTPEFDEFQRVAPVPGGHLVLGPAGEAFGAWRCEPAGCRSVAHFGANPGADVRLVGGLATADTTALAVTAAAGDFALWASSDAGGSWRPIAGPVPMPSGAYRAATVAVTGDRVLLLVDDGTVGRLWTTAPASVR